MTPLERYIDGWRRHEARAILASLAPDCVAIESFGPIYRGHDCVARWLSSWIAEGGRVLEWAVHGSMCSLDAETAE